jgi:hypothetical protein
MLRDANERRLPVIHIGLPKTATTTLQRRLFARHSEILYLGRFVHDESSDPCHHYWSCINGDVVKAMHELSLDAVHWPQVDRCRDLLRSAMESAASRHLVPVWSWESLSTDLLSRRRLRARNLKATFGDAKIIICLRNPISLIEAAYFFQLKRDNLSPDFCRWRRPYYLPIDEWLEQEYDQEIRPHLEYAETIRAYIKFFGIHNVHVFLFEELVADPVGFARRLCGAIGIDADEGLSLVRGASDNPRMTAAQFERIRSIASSSWTSVLWSLTPATMRPGLFSLDAGPADPCAVVRPRAMMSPKWKERICDDVRAGNLWLQATYDLNLDVLGYTAERHEAVGGSCVPSNWAMHQRSLAREH